MQNSTPHTHIHILATTKTDKTSQKSLASGKHIVHLLFLSIFFFCLAFYCSSCSLCVCLASFGCIFEKTCNYFCTEKMLTISYVYGCQCHHKDIFPAVAYAVHLIQTFTAKFHNSKMFFNPCFTATGYRYTSMRRKSIILKTKSKQNFVIFQMLEG